MGLTVAPLSGNLRELAYRALRSGLSPSVDRAAAALQSQHLLRSICLSVSGRVAPSAAPAIDVPEPSPTADTGWGANILLRDAEFQIPWAVAVDYCPLNAEVLYITDPGVM